MHLLSMLPALESGEWKAASPSSRNGGGDKRPSSSSGFKDPKQVIKSEEERQSARWRRKSLQEDASNQLLAYHSSRQPLAQRQIFRHVTPEALERGPALTHSSNDLMIVPRRRSRQSRRQDERMGREERLHPRQYEGAASTEFRRIPDFVSEQERETFSKGSASRAPTGDHIESKGVNGISGNGGSRGVLECSPSDGQDPSLNMSRTAGNDVAREDDAEMTEFSGSIDDHSARTPCLSPVESDSDLVGDGLRREEDSLGPEGGTAARDVFKQRLLQGQP